MKTLICPTVMTDRNDPHLYREMLERVTSFATRIQIDLMDGDFAPHKNLNPVQLWWPEDVKTDIHVMYKRPAEHLTTLISLKPHMIILHYESDGDVVSFLRHIKQFGIKAGLALLPNTKPEFARVAIEEADHILIFGGALGEPGSADLSQLSKVESILNMHPGVEIGWDGGANSKTVKQISEAGVRVVNVGSAIQKADNPKTAYVELSRLVNG